MADRGRPFPHHHPDPFHAEDRNTGLRLGVEYADGRRAATGDGLPHGLSERSRAPEILRLLESGGHGNELNWDAQFWGVPAPAGRAGDAGRRLARRGRA